MSGADTIFALSSGAPPSAIAVIRVTGPRALDALAALGCVAPDARRAGLRTLRGADGGVLDHALVVVFPGPETATGEDLVELHLHGGRAVIAAVSLALEAVDGLRPALPGEFTRRAFANGRMDLAEAEGLADLLAAETELQRRVALDSASGGLSRRIEGWRDDVLGLSAQVEAVLDFDDEDDVSDLPAGFGEAVRVLAGQVRAAVATPTVEHLREGFRVALAGPPNAGKSTLFNALLEEEAAIAARTAGTTRDVLLRNVALDGVPFTFVDMAGLRDDTSDEVEAIGVGRAGEEIARADLVLWLGEGEEPEGAWRVRSKCDLDDRQPGRSSDYRISAVTGEGMPELKRALVAEARSRLPKPGATALNQRQRALLQDALAALDGAGETRRDLLIVAEDLRSVRAAFDALVGRSGVEDVLDTIFGKFCIGK
ncbi:tRNA uridine-5-carboxymethylaminomethyl(34) synthesis GTPase MnmE [Paraurantiacibacter namhicola]|uniref:tRNA modification GTPase MnmE n=1 Tax=Paraurantiacibacter namhicola TaxID=645517 RepID=A0A1C7D5L0_9SPHN|nr:tRNA uridine-5-carboxymethylaminomethyl(34) synthesis GTPase MnmE [Paraurantiacibacter namhicola]ANU06747.1 tRNA modification GTPase MnmE [Paraurantiacibacter namhicola]